MGLLRDVVKFDAGRLIHTYLKRADRFWLAAAHLKPPPIQQDAPQLTKFQSGVWSQAPACRKPREYDMGRVARNRLW